MSNRKLFAVICLSSSLPFVFATESVAQGDLEELLERLEARHGAIEALKSREYRLDAPGRNATFLCTDIFTADNNRLGDPHFVPGNRFIIAGPFPISGAFQITALPSLTGQPHGWAGPPNHYFAMPTADPDTFKVEGIWVAPHGGMAQREHSYWMYVDWEDDCPDYVIFDFIEHTPSGGDRDPGHGGAGR